MLNPVLTLLGKVSQEDPDPERETEGCLSVPALGYPLKRSDHVRLQGFDVEGNPVDFEAYDWFARILQHEFDHLNATLYVNRLNAHWSKRWKKSCANKVGRQRAIRGCPVMTRIRLATMMKTKKIRSTS